MPSDVIAGNSLVRDVLRQRLRHMHRVISDLRRGVPVALAVSPPLIVAAAETVGQDAVADLAAYGGEIKLLVPAVRASAILRTPIATDAGAVAIMAKTPDLNSALFTALADPTKPLSAVRDQLHITALPAGAEAAVKLAKQARLLPAVLAVSADESAIPPDILRVQEDDIISYADDEAAGLGLVVSAEVPLSGAPDSRVVAFRSEGSAIDHLAVVVGQPETHPEPLVRLHSECFTGDLLGSMRCDCGEQLRAAIARMAQDGAGVLLYLGQEGRGIGLMNKLRAYNLQDRGLDTMDANRALGWKPDERNFVIGAKILRLLGVTRVRLLTNNPDKLAALSACGIEVVGREPHSVEPNGVNDEYLATKAARFGHMLD